MVVLVLIISLSGLYAGWNIGTDLRDFDFILSESFRVDLEGGYRYKDMRFSLMLSYGANPNKELSIFGCAIAVSVYPFQSLGFYIGCTLLNIGLLSGIAAPDDRTLLLSDAFIGWTIPFSWFYIEPRLSFADTLSNESTSIAGLRETIPQYSRFRLSLLLGIGI